MKMKISITVDIPKDKFKHLESLARSTGHDYDGCDAKTAIRRYLTGLVENGVHYSHENSGLDQGEDE